MPDTGWLATGDCLLSTGNGNGTSHLHPKNGNSAAGTEFVTMRRGLANKSKRISCISGSYQQRKCSSNRKSSRMRPPAPLPIGPFPFPHSFPRAFFPLFPPRTARPKRPKPKPKPQSWESGPGWRASTYCHNAIMHMRVYSEDTGWSS